MARAFKHMLKCLAGVENAQTQTTVVEQVFVYGDHSLDGIKQDWHDWAERIVPGGIIGLHDTLVPAHNSNVDHLGSQQYFIDHIQYDSRFEIVAQVDSLSILQRRK